MIRPAAFFIHQDGLPVLADLSIRESTTAPARLKVGFTMDIHAGVLLMSPSDPDPMPPPDGFEGRGLLGAEFRLEMN